MSWPSEAVGKDVCKMPDESCEALIHAELRGIGQTEHLMVDLRCECKMYTCCTAILKRSAAWHPLVASLQAVPAGWGGPPAGAAIRRRRLEWRDIPDHTRVPMGARMARAAKSPRAPANGA